MTPTPNPRQTWFIAIMLLLAALLALMLCYTHSGKLKPHGYVKDSITINPYGDTIYNVPITEDTTYEGIEKDTTGSPND